MKILITTSLVLIYLGVFYSCRPKQEKQQSSLTTVSIDVKEKAKSVNFSDLFSEVELLPLETSDECLIGEISKIIFYKNCFYIADKEAQCVYVFNRDGKFISKIGTVGRGPGEYVDLMNMYIDKSKDQLILDVDWKYLIYDLKTNHLVKEESYKFNGVEKIYLGEECFGAYMENTAYGNMAKNIVIEQKGVVLNSFSPISPSLLGFSGMVDQVFSENEKGDCFLSMPLNDTIYTVTKDTVLPYCRVDFGDKNLPKNYMDGVAEEDRLTYLLTAPYFKSVCHFVENDNYIYFVVNGGVDSKVYNYFYFKKRQKDYLYTSINMDENGLALVGAEAMFCGDRFYINALPIDIASSYVDVIKRFCSSVKTTDDAANAEKCQKIIQSSTFKKLMQIVDESDEDSNPILAIAHLKLEE